ncbi:hypothetical protein FHS43_004867 [Streptosporangium becharense]|uniref:Uncharacterized protein n=1 Tax=Streptosporangium becharense TaxID=1816182 RepID=A0A7W9IID7_9ACTN|nr:hypothetical protein [Streptosporangium becharense]MBB2913563.1 hypothetical protein [Streptosporangium becharense]MBB5821253.1 hypothetical protein [Streptosporangium becharense]
MSYSSTRSLNLPSIQEELVRDRIRTLHQEAEQHRRAVGLQRVQRARRDAERATARLRAALLRLV